MPSQIPPSDVLLQSPYLLRLSKRGKLAPSHLQSLLEAAGSPKRPKEPDPWDCCGSNCKPCVKELWKMECRGWEECHENGAEEEDTEEADESEGSVKVKEKDEDLAEIRSRAGTPKIEIGIDDSAVDKDSDASSLPQIDRLSIGSG